MRDWMDLNGDGKIDGAEMMFAGEMLCTSREEHEALFGDAGDFEDDAKDDFEIDAMAAETTDNKPVNKDFTKPYYTQLIVGDIPTVAGHTPTTLFTDRHELDDGTVVWSAHIGDQSGNRLGDNAVSS